MRVQKKLIRNARRASENQRWMLPPIENESLEDSVIVLSDNEDQSTRKETRNKAERRTKKRPLELSIDNNNQNSECLHNPSKRRKKNETDPLIKGGNSNKKNSGITTIVLDDEKIDGINQGADEIVVVWSNTKTSPELDSELQNGSVIPEEDVSFMIDRTPDMKNLSCLKEELIDLVPEIEERQENNKRGFPSFSSFGLKLPKAQNISGHIKMKKPTRRNRLRSKRRMPSLPQVFSTFPPYSTPAMFSRVPACAGIKFGTFDTSFDIDHDDDVICEGSGAIICRAVIGTYPKPAHKFGTAPPLPPLPPPAVPPPPPPPPPAVPPPPPPLRFGNNPLPPYIMPPTEQHRRCMQRQFPASTSYTCGSGSVPYRPASPTPDPVPFRTCRTFKSGTLRDIIIDGNNVAMQHKSGKVFSEEGLKLVVEYFQQRGHTVKVFLPQSRFSPLLEKWYTEGIVVYTPSRRIGNTNRRITPYDDRYILEYATLCGGIVISSDQYRDLYAEKPEWRDTIEKRLMAPTFVGDYVMFPSDPLGRRGPNLETFLRH
ncbi:transcription initiation factor TFIID subunit 3-like isoform X2 [Ceratina calcarata]|nr:transcription initiation factor TFIID subunit 3-like isoform X2 [Ceratina calcarata]